MTKKILVTSALLYANGPLHVGHLIEYIQTDIYVRYLRLRGRDVLFCCADDTHGAPIQINAEKLNMTPEQLIKKFYIEHKRDFDSFKISFDNYYTTHSDENRAYSDLFFERANKKGFIFKKEVTQLWCNSCKRFLPDRYVKGECPKCGAKDQYGDVCEVCGTTYKTTELKNPRCTICGGSPVKKKSEHYFFRLSAFSEKLDSWLTKNRTLQKEIVNSVRQWIKEGLSDWDISRDGPYFGFPIPGEKNLYYYVWWDAPIGYLASAENLLKKKNQRAEDYWNDSDVIHFIGKDIIYFHFLFWPAVLMACGMELPKNIAVHGFLTVDGEKMSKSRGTFITAEDFLRDHDAESLRYFYAGMLGKKLSDIDLNFDDLAGRVNNELVANIGNFCYRAISFTNRNLDSRIKAFEDNTKLIEEVEKKIRKIEKSYESLNFREAVSEIMSISTMGNKYMQDMAPWKLIKEDKEKAREVMGLCINIARILSILMSPVLPKFSRSLQEQLNMKEKSWDDLGFSLKDHRVGEAKILVSKIERKEKEAFPFDLRVAEITEARPHPDADKLIILDARLGDETRQLVAGLKEYYAPEELVGKKIIVLCNLKPAKLRGEKSQGMLLAAEKDGVVKVIEAGNSAPGEQVMPAGFDVNRGQITFDQFGKLNKLNVRDKKLLFGNSEIAAGKQNIKIDMPDGSKVR